MNDRYIVGLDNGGTANKFTVMDTLGNYLVDELIELPSRVDEGPGAALAALQQAFDAALSTAGVDRSDVIGVGFDSPGPASADGVLSSRGATNFSAREWWGFDYRTALDNYYAQGPAADWRERCISAYASSHPIEDWAETWGHYLHIHDVLETAATHQVIGAELVDAGIDERISTWRELSITLNELNRSIGHGDAYPFVVTSAVQDKLAYVDAAISRLRTPP